MSSPKSTRQAIFEAAVDLFAEQGYHEVSMRKIADAVGIRSSSIYNHYESKNEILLEIYAYFNDNMQALKPDLDVLLEMAETAHPLDVLRGTIFTYPQEIALTMSKAMLVTASMARTDTQAGEVIYRNLIQMAYDYDVPLLERMLELGRIEPMDPQGFALLHSCFSHSTAVRFYSNQMLDDASWLEGLELLFELVRVKE